MRDDGDDRYVFICNVDRKYPRQGRIELRGRWGVTVLETLTGKQFKVNSDSKGEWTRFLHRFEGCGSVLLRLRPEGSRSTLATIEPVEWKVAGELSQISSVSLSEPNVLLLDMARYCIDDEKEWSSVEEILRTDNIAREKLGIPTRQDNLAQPYRVAKVAPKHTLHLLYEFNTETSAAISGAQLALEGASNTSIELDGRPVPSTITGWWVDEEIHTVALPEVKPGKHSLKLSVPFGELTNIERIYILGQFGVDLRGRTAVVTDLALDKFQIGDYCRQGLPFYAGDVSYDFQLKGYSRTAIQATQFAAPLLRVELDGKPAGIGKIAFEPHILDLGDLDPDTSYKLRVTTVGNRDHAFGALHLPRGLTKWYGPDAWRTNGDKWTYEYAIQDMGLLAAPRILTTDPQLASKIWDAGSVNQDLWF